MLLLAWVLGLCVSCAQAADNPVVASNATTLPRTTTPQQTYDPSIVLGSVVIVVGFALLFDFSNGFHDTANSVATCVGTCSMYVPWCLSRLPGLSNLATDRHLKERVRTILTVVFAACLNFLPAFVSSLHVANQISKVINVSQFPDHGTFVPLGIICTYATLISALFWNFFTWQLGLPSSSSHALIGGLVGSGLAMNGINGVTWSQLVNIVYGLLGSPVYAGIVALVIMWIVRAACYLWVKYVNTEVDQNNRYYRLLEVLSTGGLAWLHGANDAQKTMGVIAACLLSAGYTTTHTFTSGSKTITEISIAPWVMFTCYSAIALGTLFGGWSIIGKMALQIYPQMTRSSGFCANAGVLVSLSVATYGLVGIPSLPSGLPVSTTHAMNCGIVASGVGEKGLSAVQWKVMSHMVVAWIVTIPITMFLGFIFASMMVLPGAWSPFFCIFWGVLQILFMICCIWKQRHAREQAAKTLLKKYASSSTAPVSKVDPDEAATLKTTAASSSETPTSKVDDEETTRLKTVELVQSA